MTTSRSVPITIEAATELFWRSSEQHDHSPMALRGMLSIDDAYRIQQAVLERKVRAGDRRIGPPPDMALNLVDNVAQKAFVVGEMVRLEDRDLAGVQMAFAYKGESVGKASGAEVLGDPIASLAWLANALSRYDCRLEAGDLVMSGSFTPPFDLASQGEIRSEFEPIGMVCARFR